MNDLRKLLERLSALDVKLSLEGGNLDIDAPPGVLTGDLLETLRRSKPALVAHLSRTEEARRLAREPIPTAPPADAHPLSFAQRRIWFLDRLEGPSSAYNLSAAFRITGPLDEAALTSSLAALMERHPMLRARFTDDAGEPKQIISNDIHIHIYRSGATTEADAYRFIRAAADTPFDLAAGAPLRVTLVNIGTGGYLLGVTLAHIVADGWTIGLFAREWSMLYDSFHANVPAPLRPPRSAYADYAVWQRRMADAGGWEEALDRRAARLAGAPLTLEIPTDRPRKPRQTFSGDVAPFRLEPADTARIKRLAGDSGTTLFMVTLAAYAVLLARHTGTRDLLVGVPIANRNRIECESVVGVFANIVPVRISLGEGITFRRLLANVRDEMLAAFADQDVPFDLLVERLSPARDLSRNPLVQTMFAFQNTPSNAAAPDLAFAGTVIASIPLPDRSVRFDIETHAWEESDHIAGELLFNTDLYDTATARRLAADYAWWLARLAGDADRPVEDVATLSPDAWQTVVHAWNATAVAHPAGLTLPGLIARQAESTPDATAVICGTARLTYAQLLSRANRLAGALAAAGARPGTLVGLMADRSEQTVVALLAIMQSGAGFLPLDPAYPAERIAFMLADSGAVAVVADEAGRALAGTTPVVSLTAAGTAPLTPPDPDDTAYVIYTSGSTGTPKGVRILHRNIVNFLLSMAKKPGLSARDILLAVTTISFDISLLELFLPLTVGATTVVARREEVTDGTALARLLASSGATIMQATPATWRLLLAAGWQAKPGFTALCGGEALPRSLADLLAGNGATVWNMYGPTETTVWSTIRHVTPGGPEIEPLGRPIDNTHVYILDSRLAPVPTGAVGELYIGGAGVSPGYLNRPDLTAERFLDNPFIPGDRIYRTGDLARQAADGTIRYLGRTDTQVKLRGYRIELGELEAVIAADPLVAACACAIRRSSAGELLVAYVRPESGAFDEEAVRRRVRAWAPEYMNPSWYVVLEHLPLTPNGKIDRNRLPEPAPTSGRAGLRLPGTGTERLVAGVWAEVLGREQISAEENVFEIGAHSFLAMKVHHRLHSAHGFPLEVVDLFRYPTVAALARHIDEIGTGKESVSTPTASVDRRKAAFAQQRDRTLKARGIERK
ncbi:MAG TPA: amino acid adenylation domain-containing protein [Candidatus Ozemobacteraceae bacterium]|nr:amino acid adenylation domain-containing protein [Candidatus Ozemobacteraceae bacterium]